MNDPTNPSGNEPNASSPYGQQPPYGVTPPLTPDGKNPYAQPQYGQPQNGQPPYGQVPYGAIPPNPYVMPKPDHPRAVTILVLGILSLVGCSFALGLIAGIPAWVMGHKVLREIDASGGRIGGRGMVNAGMILGIVSTVVSVLFILLIVGAVIVGQTDTVASINAAG